MNTIELKEKQKQEAIKRMRMLNLHTNTINEFEKDDVINLSENGGILYWLDETQRKIVEKFEEKHKAVVYHVIRSFTEFGELLSLLYVSNDSSEWGWDNEDIKFGTILAYVKNLDDDFCSEFGSIGIKSQFGGLMRVS